MADNKNLQDRRDDVKVDQNDKNEVEYLHRQYPERTHGEIREAIEKYGPYRKDIEEKLRR